VLPLAVVAAIAELAGGCWRICLVCTSTHTVRERWSALECTDSSDQGTPNAVHSHHVPTEPSKRREASGTLGKLTGSHRFPCKSRSGSSADQWGDGRCLSSILRIPTSIVVGEQQWRAGRRPRSLAGGGGFALHAVCHLCCRHRHTSS
jgi:hypothetical protein